MLLLFGINTNSFAQTAPQDTTLLKLFKDVPDSFIQNYDTTGVSYIKFAGYAKMDIKNFTGLRVHFDPDFEKLVNENNIERAKNDYIVWFIPKEEEFILRRYENELITYTSEYLGVERLGYKFSITKNSTQIKNNEPASDTLVVFKSEHNGYMGYRVSDIKNMESNIKTVDSLYAAEIEQKKKAASNALRERIDTELGQYKNKLFPNGELYLFAYSRSNERLDGINGYLEGLPNKFLSTNLILTNTPDLKYIKENLRENHRDSVWLVQKISFDQILDKSVIISLKTPKSSGNDYPPNISDKEIAEAKANPAKGSSFKNFDYWVNRTNDSLMRDANLRLSFEFLKENNRNSLTLRVYFDTDSSSNLPLFERYSSNQVRIIDKVYDERIDELDFRFARPFGKYYNVFYSNASGSSGNSVDTEAHIYSIDNLATKKYIAFFSYRNFVSYFRIVEAERKEEEEIKKLTQVLYTKYGKQYVDQAFKNNIIVGMHEELLTFPLRLWRVTNKSVVSGGYTLYCNSILDSSKRLTIKVLNKKVVYVSY